MLGLYEYNKVPSLYLSKRLGHFYVTLDEEKLETDFLSNCTRSYRKVEDGSARKSSTLILPLPFICLLTGDGNET